MTEKDDEDKKDKKELGVPLFTAMVDEANFAPDSAVRTWTPQGSKKPIPQNEADPKTGRRLLLD